jgi:hypothetical protein
MSSSRKHSINELVPPIDEWLADVPSINHPLFRRLVSLTDAFCDAKLSDEYKELARDMGVAVCGKRTRADRGKPEAWACAIIYCLGRVNFLTDPSQTPHLTRQEIAAGFAVSLATMDAKARIIRHGLDLMPFHPEWTLPSKLEDNPLI